MSLSYFVVKNWHHFSFLVSKDMIIEKVKLVAPLWQNSSLDLSNVRHQFCRRQFVTSTPNAVESDKRNHSVVDLPELSVGLLLETIEYNLIIIIIKNSLHVFLIALVVMCFFSPDKHCPNSCLASPCYACEQFAQQCSCGFTPINSTKVLNF